MLEFVRVYEAGAEKYFPSGGYEKELLNSYSAGVDALKKLVIDPPLIVLVTLANAKGYRLGIGSIAHPFTSEPIPFDRDVMLIPDVQVESLDRRDIDVLRPILDIIWNAGGYERSLHFDENNNRKQPR